MSLPNDINLNTYEKMASMKNMFGNSIIEILKPNIKSHQNESVIKMLEMTKDKPETYMELLAVAIFHKNFEIIKYMVEKFKITEGDSPFMNALSFYNSILPDNSDNKLNEPKENYNPIQCPFVIMSGIGGDVEIYKYLSKNNLISNKKELGIVGLSKKLKNSFYSNIIGACCYYGRAELLEYLLKNDKYDINILTTEKKSKSGLKAYYHKEYNGLTPAMLCVVGPIKDEDSVKILKILNNYNCNFKVWDHNKDNLLHLAVKNNKFETAKFLVDELKIEGLMEENNKENYNPMTLAQHLNNEEFINYFSEKEKVNEKEIQDNINDLINESNITKDKNNKKKKKKNKANDEPTTLNSSEYQETLKEIKTTNKKKNNYYNYNDEKEEEYNQNENTKPKKNKIKKNNENVSNYKVGDNIEKLRALLETPKPKKKKIKKDANNNVELHENKEEKKEEKKEDKKEIKENVKEDKEVKEIKSNNNIINEENDDNFIIGLGSKNKKNKKLKKNINKEEKEKEREIKAKEEEEKIKLQQQLEEERIKEEELKRKLEEEEEIKRKEAEREKELEEQRKSEEQRKIEEEKEKERIRKLKEEELQRKLKEEEEKKQKEEEIKLQRKIEEEKKQKELRELQQKEKEKKEINEESEESDEEDYSSEKNFLSDQEEESQEKSKEKEKEGTKKYISKEDYDKLNKKYLELERRISILEKEKEEMSSLMRTLFLQNKTNMHIPLSANKEENINDLMNLANKELENKNKIINELEGKVSKLNLNNVNEFSANKLKEYKDFYSKQLKTINDALKKY